MKKLIALAAAIWAVPALGWGQTSSQGVQISGSITPSQQVVDNPSNSSKLTEYRDLRNVFYLPQVRFSVKDPQAGRFFDVTGTNVSRDDQTIAAVGGRQGRWNFAATWTGTPHNYSNKALTPYIRKGPGLFEVPATIPITFKKLGTAAGDTAGVLASDSLTAAYQSTFLAPTPLSTQTNAGHFAFAWTAADAINVGVAYDRREKSGLKSMFGPIGDRPPRTLNIQLTEPVDYRTNDITFSAEYRGRGYQISAEYLFSDFVNRIDTLQWQNVYATPASGATFDTWDRSVSAYGVMPLPPDNRYQKVSTTFEADLPLESQLTATVAYGRLQQNEALLPYSYNSDQLVVNALPRSTASAAMNTVNFAADYVVSPVQRLNVRAFYRNYDLKNETPESQWQYVTSDTSNLSGSVTYLNKRVSLPYAWKRQNAGADATWRLPARSTLTFGYEREVFDRTHREVDQTTEDILRATWRTRAANWMSLEARYLQGKRNGSAFNSATAAEMYWYTAADKPDNNNPAVTFENHPDMRRFDVADRLRRQFAFRLNLTPRDIVALSAYVRYRKDDFTTDVRPSQPLLGTGLKDEAATTPGDQLGRLNDEQTRYGLDLFGQLSERITLNAFVNYDQGRGLQRGIEFNENNKANPSAIATATLGPWTRASSQWTGDFTDRTWSGGLGTSLQLVPDVATLLADYTVSLARVNLAYSGFGATNFDGTPFAPTQEFAFSSPPDMRENRHVASARLEIPLREVTLFFGYTYEKYLLEDWQQGGATPWVESVGADTLLRDSSDSNQWGNRLFNLGTYLAPSYDAHIGIVGFRYRF